MMFMMPIPPTISDTPAIEPNKSDMTMVMTSSVSAISAVPSTMKSSFAPLRMRCRCRSNRVDLILGVGHAIAERAERRSMSTLLKVEPETRFLIVV